MFFNDLLQRRLASLLRPWLRHEPELEFKLGFLHSHSVAKNLNFDPSVLNQLLDDSTPLSFKDVTVDQLSLRVSYWSNPSFVVQVKGVHVTLSVREGDEDGGLRLRRKPTDTDLEDVKNVLAQIDPEGSALHDMMERISGIDPSVSWSTSLLNVILNRCKLQIHDIHLQVLLPILNNSFACLWGIKEVTAESWNTEHGCFVRGVITSLFSPLQEITLTLDWRGFEIGLKSEDRISYVLPSVDLFTSIKLKDLQLTDFNISTPDLRFLFSPLDLHIILAFDRLSSNKSNCARSGRQLWKIASSRISTLISTPRFSWHKLLDDVNLWLCYVHAYENLLLLVGYPAENIIKRSVVRMSLDDIFSRSLKSQWNLVSEVEKKLPAEAIAHARRITRYRKAKDVQQAKDHSNESLVNSHLQKTLPGLALIWNIICSILDAIVRFLFLHKFFTRHKGSGRGGIASEDSCLQRNFSLRMGEVSIMLFPMNTIRPPVGGKLVSDVGISYSELLSFCLSIDAFLLTHTKNICEQCYFFTCGHLKIMSSAVENGLNKKERWKEKVDHANTILWGEPAQMFCAADTSSCSTNGTEGISVPFLEKLLGEMCLNWKNSGSEFESSKMQYVENPWFLCEIKSFLTDQGLENLNGGFWKCSLIVGKLNFVLNFLSLLSIALLFKQIQHTIYCASCSSRTKVSSPTIPTVEDLPVIDSDGQCKTDTTRTELAILGMLPMEHVQIGVFIGGPCIQISMRKGHFNGGNAYLNPIVVPDDLHLVFDVHNIEFAVWPSLKSDFGSSGYSGLDDVGPDCLWSMDPQIIEIPISDNDIYSCHWLVSLCMYLKVNGLNAYLDASAENQQNQIIVLSPIIVRLSSLREELHSFSTAVIAFSSALQGISTGLTFLLYMDELFVLVKVMVAVRSTVSCAFTSFDSFNFQDFTRHQMVCADSESEGTFMVMAKGRSLISKRTLFAINGTLEFKSIDMIFHDSRKSNGMETLMIPVDVVSSKKLPMGSMPEYGIWVSIQRTYLNCSFEPGKMEAFSDFSGIQSVIFRNQSETGKTSDQFELRSLLQHSLNCLYEVTLSRCTFTFWLEYIHNALPSGSESNSDEGSNSRGNGSKTLEDSLLEIENEGSRIQSFISFQKLGSSPNIMALTSNHKFIVKIVVGEICMARCSLKNTLVEGHNLNNLESSLIVGGEFQTVSCQIQGGTIFLEPTALAMFVQCCASFSCRIRNLLHVVPSTEKDIIAETVEDVVILDGRPGQGTQNIFPQAQWEQLELFIIDLSEFSLILVVEDESGLLRELLLEADVHLNLDLANMNRKFSLGLSRLSILSQMLHRTVKQGTSETQSPHFSSATSSDLSPHFVHGDPTVEFQHTDGIHPVLNHASCSSAPASQEESAGDISHKNYILEHLHAFVSVEIPVSGDETCPPRLNHDWVGSGSIRGFNMTISLPEIQMLLSTIESLSGVFGKETSGNVEQKKGINSNESGRRLEERVPDGAIVAIQDVHQHMYMTVEGVENKYSLIGAVHYSLVGERALFRVKYQTERRWKSSVLWFSLISLHAKNDSGEPLRLNYHPGSDFVDISSTNDNGWALWRTISSKPESGQGDFDLEAHNLVAKNTFYLVNKKNGRAVSFVDGVPEFVRKPGNLFKWKVFCDLSPASDAALLDSHPVMESATNLQHGSNVNSERGKFPSIVITIEKITLTIFHELSDTMEKVPLLQGSISADEFIVQILLAKARIMSTLKIMLTYFDSQHSLWRELVHPVEVIVFYRSKFHVQDSEMHGVPVNFYARIKKLGISITELSLDILLFVIGKLNLAGPYAIRSSMILANCCKVENHSGLNLVCQFYDNREATIGRKQSSTIILRHLTLVNQPPEMYSVSIKLAWQGAALTLPIHLSMLHAGATAWRTRILSLKDSKTYPGPFVVVDISKYTEDGLSLVVSPLLSICNETEFSMELRFQRPQQEEAESASVFLKTGDTIDDSTAAFDAMNSSGGLKKALMSLSVGNFLFSFRPDIKNGFRNFKKSLSVEWTEDLRGEKAVRLSGLFDKLSYKVQKALSVEPVRCSFSTAHCSLKSQDGHVADVHFLIQSIGRNIPVVKPQNDGYVPGNRNSPVALREQKEIFILPTVRVFNLLQSEIHVLLTDTDPCAAVSSDYVGNQANICCGSTVDFYVNPATIYFIVTLTAYNSSCKPVNSGDWVKKLQKQNDMQQLDIDLEFGGGKYFASSRLFRGYRGILEVAIFTSYTLKNDTDYSLFCFAPNQKPLSKDDAEKLSFRIPPELGSFLPPKSARSWFMKYNKVHLKLVEEKASDVLLDLDALSGLSELGLEVEERYGLKHIAKLGLSLGPIMSKVDVPSHIVSIVPRYVVFNESEEVVLVRQCYLEDGLEGTVAIKSKQKVALQFRSVTSMKREVSVFENLLRNHRNTHDDSLVFIQFRPNEAGLGWSGPVCIASMGRFFLKFRRSLDSTVQQSNQVIACGNILPEFAALDVVEEGSTLGLHFHKPPNINLPYRIENFLQDTFITYYQKGSLEPEILRTGSCVNYVWDDSTLPHRLVIQINDVNLLREINLDKLRAWKPFYRVGLRGGLGFHIPLLDRRTGELKRTDFGESNGIEMVNVGYEVYADGPTRVLRICEFSGSHKADPVLHSSGKIHLRISYFAIQLFQHAKQERDANEPSVHTPIIIARLENINLDSVFTEMYNYNQFGVQSLSVDEKWEGAPFAAMLRRHQSDYGETNDNILHVVLVLLTSSSSVKQVKYSSVVLQPLDLNLDEETLMRIVPFWRTSLSDSSSQSRQYYFDHFEIHPIKIIASFLPGDSYSSYSSTQETLRSLLHSVIKVPAIKSKTVELNGVLVTHALITIRELFLKCAQHYSWYAMRAVYIAKGSPLLPPAFASIFDDLASSSLDVFFDPSRALLNLPGLTIGTFKLISKGIDGKGFSGTKRYFGDLGKTVKTAGSNILFAAVTEITDSVLKGAETSGFNGMLSGFHQGVLKLAMEPSLLGTAFMEGGPDRKIKLDRSPGVDELYVEGYLQAMLDTIYKQEYLRVRVIDNQVFLKNLPPNSSLIDEIMDRVKGFLVSKALLKGDSSTSSRSLRHIRGETEWKIGPTVLTLCEHLFVSFAIRWLRKKAGNAMSKVKLNKKLKGDDEKAVVPASEPKVRLVWKWGIGQFVLSGLVAYIDGRLCRCIPNPLARRIVSGFLLSFLDKNEDK